jgi:hypothetical protein
MPSPSNDYHFITYWRVPGTVEEVAAVLADERELPRWWPSVYLTVQRLAPGDEHGLHKEVALHTKGWLPYTLNWAFRVSEVHPNGFTLQARGDFVGRGIWTFVPDGSDVIVVYDWKIRVDKPLLSNLSFILKPVFEANHRWAMARGEESLKLELARRRARGSDLPVPLAAPPGPTRWPKPSTAIVGAAGLLAGLWLITRKKGEPQSTQRKATSKAKAK